PPALGNLVAAPWRHLVGPGAGEVAPAHDDPARALRDVAEQAADQGRLAHAVATQQPDRATPPDAQVDAVQHMAAAVPGVHVVRIEEGVGPRAHAGSPR